MFLLLALMCTACVAGTDAFPAAASSATARLPLTPANAAKYFAEFTHDCRADDGKLWGVSLCGPMLFVDPATHQVVASQADADGRLKPAGHGMFTGVMPPDQIIANTSAWWSGTHWIELLWPVLVNQAMYPARLIMAHESYHRVQARIVPIHLVGTNTQLQTVYGRYTMELEWRALAAALQAPTAAARRQAVSDALLFRAARHHRFPEAQASEVALMRDEGLAQYTGVMVGEATAAQRKAEALDLLREGSELPSFVRSFAYVSGPAYGLLLNRYRPDWRKQIVRSKQGLAAMLASALHLNLAHMPLDTFAARATHYGGPALLASENARKAKSDRELAHYRSLLVTGPVLVLPLEHTRKEFNPRNVLSLGKSGTVYPTLHLFDDWGSIDVEQGALLAADQPRLTVSAPSGETVTGTIRGPGWVLKLAPGWRLVPATRKGDFTLRHVTSDATQRQ
ncbi:MAG: hypothetical protein ACREP2_08525 [Rhodanobacteraceae bacterium]